MNQTKPFYQCNVRQRLSEAPLSFNLLWLLWWRMCVEHTVCHLVTPLEVPGQFLAVQSVPLLGNPRTVFTKLPAPLGLGWFCGWQSVLLSAWGPEGHKGEVCLPMSSRGFLRWWYFQGLDIFRPGRPHLNSWKWPFPSCFLFECLKSLTP
jgi:hypothetical protein